MLIEKKKMSQQYSNNNSRPSSYYDNYTTEAEEISGENNDVENRFVVDAEETPNLNRNDVNPKVVLRDTRHAEFERSFVVGRPTHSASSTTSDNGQQQQQQQQQPSQTQLLCTTVPQNIVAQNIADKHVLPTRHSLRHSRMIALNVKNGRVPKKYLPAIIRYHKLAKSLLGLLILLGSALCFLSVWLIIWAPNLRQRDNPHWSGIPVLFSGIIGLILMCCFRKEYPGMKNGYITYSVKVMSVLLSTVAAITALVACVFAILHLVALYTLHCTPSTRHLDNNTCLCFNPPPKRVVSAEQAPQTNGTNSAGVSLYFHYTDLSCVEVDSVLTILVMFSCGTNFFAGLLELWYVYLHWASRYLYTYSQVRTNNNTPIIIANSLS